MSKGSTLVIMHLSLSLILTFSFKNIQIPHPWNKIIMVKIPTQRQVKVVKCPSYDRNRYPGDIKYNQIPYPGDRPYNQTPVVSPIPPSLGLNNDRCIKTSLFWAFSLLKNIHVCQTFNKRNLLPDFKLNSNCYTM